MNPQVEGTVIEQMVSAMPLAAFAADENWKILFFNKCAEEITGVSASEAVGMRVRDVFNGGLGRKGCPVFDAVSAGKPAQDVEVRFNDSQDKEVVCLVSVSPLSKDGRRTGYMGFLKVADKKGGEAFDYVNSLPTPILVMDKDFKVTFMNSAALRMVNRTLDQVKGRPCFEFMNTNKCKVGNCATRRAMTEDKVLVGDAIAHLPTGDMPVRGMVGPLKDACGNIVGAVEIVPGHNQGGRDHQGDHEAGRGHIGR
jgi:methyl-accepting chemotaxis protein